MRWGRDSLFLYLICVSTCATYTSFVVSVLASGPATSLHFPILLDQAVVKPRLPRTDRCGARGVAQVHARPALEIQPSVSIMATPTPGPGPASAPAASAAVAKELFISYGRKPTVTQFVHKLKADLERNGFSVWLDSHDIPAGSDWHGAIGAGLSCCKAILPVLTNKYIGSRYCVNEVHTQILKS